jgi:hypothetical protein
LLGALGAPLEWAMYAPTLAASLEGDNLHVSAPYLRFLTGKTLEQLHNGAPAAFDGQLSLSLDGFASFLNRAVERFVVSFDIWEEKFSVTTTTKERRSASHLSETGAESWCFSALTLPLSALPREGPFWLRLELRLEDSKDQAGLLEGSGISLARLIEIFSRRARPQQPPWQAEVGPLRLADLKKL